MRLWLNRKNLQIKEKKKKKKKNQEIPPPNFNKMKQQQQQKLVLFQHLIYKVTEVIKGI